MKKIFLTLLLLMGCSTVLFKERPLIDEIVSNKAKANKKRLEKIVGSGVSPNETYGGASALLYAMSASHPEKRYEIVETLLSLGADINFSGNYDATDYERDPDKINLNIRAALHPIFITSGPLAAHIVFYDYYQFDYSQLHVWQQLLIKHKFNPGVVDNKGDTPLHHAVTESLKKERLNLMIPFLISQGASCYSKNADGMSPAELIKNKAKPALKQEFLNLCKK